MAIVTAEERKQYVDDLMDKETRKKFIAKLNAYQTRMVDRRYIEARNALIPAADLYATEVSSGDARFYDKPFHAKMNELAKGIKIES